MDNRGILGQLPCRQVDDFCESLKFFTIEAPPWLDHDFALATSVKLQNRTILCIQPGGALHQWNQEHPTCAVQQGDQIQKFNGEDFNGQTGPVTSLTLFRPNCARSTKLAVFAAMHSSLVSCAIEPVRTEADACGVGQRLQQSSCLMLSCLTGELVTEPLDGAYWSGHDHTKPVLFKQAIRRVVELGCSTFLELGSGKLLSLGQRCCGSLGAELKWLALPNPDEVSGVQLRLEALTAQTCPHEHLDSQHQNEGDGEAALKRIFDKFLPDVHYLNKTSTLYHLGLDSFRVEQLHSALKREGFQCEMWLGCTWKG